MATVRRIAGDLHRGTALLPCLPCLSLSGRHTVPTTAYLYGLETAGPTRQREYRRRRERYKDGPMGVGPLESAGPSHGPRTPLIRQDGEWRQ